MKKPHLLAAAALLLGTSLTGVAFAAPHLLGERAAGETDVGRDGPSTIGAGERFRLADSDHGRRHEARDQRRGHDDEDDDDEDDDGDRAGGDRTGRPAVTGPTDPNAPVPDSGLFQGKTRPKVEVN